MSVFPRLFAAAALSLAAAGAQAETYKLSSLEWPPFTGPALPQGGASAAVVRAAFAEAGAEVEIVFAPWQRAVALAEEGMEGVSALFPEYQRADSPRSTCSASIGSSPLGFAENVGAPVTWETLDDLKGLRIGAVDGYANTVAFDQMMADGALKVDLAPDDTSNLRKVSAGRIQLAVVDANVLDYIARTNDKVDAAKIRFNARPLELKTLHVCFGKHGVGEAARAAFARGLARIDPDAIMAAYFQANAGS